MLTEKNALSIWLKNNLPSNVYNISSLAGDASLRQYYRITYADQSRILMDSHLDISAFHKFIEISAHLNSRNLPAPKIYATNNDYAFALIEDFGDDLFLGVVNPDNRESLYKKALDILIKMQDSTHTTTIAPNFTAEKILMELNLFNEWFIDKYLHIKLSNSQKQIITKSFNKIIDILLSMPQSFTHMDYHSRNIIVLKTGELGIIDYQDAKVGPFTYDLVSILKDCYIKLPKAFVSNLLNYYYSNSHLANSLTNTEFVRAFNLCGLQRHIKVLGIFSRLHIRDNKDRYLQDLPLVLHYTLDCLKKYEEFTDFYEIMTNIDIKEKIELNPQFDC